jgi:hypothetical protein
VSRFDWDRNALSLAVPADDDVRCPPPAPVLLDTKSLLEDFEQSTCRQTMFCNLIFIVRVERKVFNTRA